MEVEGRFGDIVTVESEIDLGGNVVPPLSTSKDTAFITDKAIVRAGAKS